MSEPPSTQTIARTAGLGTALLMATVLLVISFARVVSGGVDALDVSVNVVDAVMVGGFWGTKLAYNMVWFAATLVALHAVFGVACWLLALLSMRQPRLSGTASARECTVAWTLLLTVWVLVANAAWYPHSSLGEPYADAASAGFAGITLAGALTVFVVAVLAVTLGGAALQAFRRLRLRPLHVGAAALVALAVPGIVAIQARASGRPGPALDRPNVIVIGIDSLRCDVTSLQSRNSWTPAVDRFLTGAARFNDAMTPLARTFPSWSAILTGKHPHTTGAVINLIPRDRINLGDTLGEMARRAGYVSQYAIDEVRFSNIDATYGFDRTVTPPIGATDFLVGWFGDTPLSNVLVNSTLGRWLLPTLHANRAAYRTYEPDTFVERLERELTFDRPTLLAVHLTLPHWPYGWATSPAAAEMSAGPKAYEAAVRRADRQFGDVMALLERRGALRNAVVVVLSDHGEALGRPGDSFVGTQGIGGLSLEEQGPVIGHGTSVLSPHQYRTVLAIRTYGDALAGRVVPATLDAPASVEDLAPTLAALAGFTSREKFDGLSLAPLLRGEPGAVAAVEERVRFTESGFNPRGIDARSVSVNMEAVEQAVHFYRVDPITDRVELRPEKIPVLLGSRQYAAIRGNTLLAAIPGRLTSGYHYVVLDRRGGFPRRLTETPDRDRDPQLWSLWQALHAKFPGALDASGPEPIAPEAPAR